MGSSCSTIADKFYLLVRMCSCHFRSICDFGSLQFDLVKAQVKLLKFSSINSLRIFLVRCISQLSF